MWLLGSKQWEWEQPGSHSVPSPSWEPQCGILFGAVCWSVWLVTFRWPVGSSVSFSIEIRADRGLGTFVHVLPRRWPGSSGVSWQELEYSWMGLVQKGRPSCSTPVWNKINKSQRVLRNVFNWNFSKTSNFKKEECCLVPLPSSSLLPFTPYLEWRKKV